MRITLVRSITRIYGHSVRRGDSPDHEDHRLGAPPTLALEGGRAGRAGAVEQAGTMADKRPAARFAQIINAAPEELPGIRRIVAQGQPRGEVLAVFGADDFARGLLRVRGEDFILA